MTYYSDCFVYGSNPSDIGGGFTICDESGKVVWKEEVLKKGFTNNEGELLGVLYACSLANHGDIIKTDSQNTLAWIKRGKPKARPDLEQPATMAQTLVRLKGLKLEWGGRDTNLAGIHNDNNPPLLSMYD